MSGLWQYQQQQKWPAACKVSELVLNTFSHVTQACNLSLYASLWFGLHITNTKDVSLVVSLSAHSRGCKTRSCLLLWQTAFQPCLSCHISCGAQAYKRSIWCRISLFHPWPTWRASHIPARFKAWQRQVDWHEALSMVEATKSRQNKQSKQTTRSNPRRCSVSSMTLHKADWPPQHLATHACTLNSAHCCRALRENFGDIPTFATLQGKQLHFEGDQRPFKRCLAFQASQSRHSALSQGRISPLDVPEISGSAWSNNSYLERVKVSYLRAT